jgi:hypothetical protein
LLKLGRRQPEDDEAAAQNLRRALLTPERRPMKRRDISIATGAAVLAPAGAF